MPICNGFPVHPQGFHSCRKTAFCHPKADSDTTVNSKVIYAVISSGPAVFCSVLVTKPVLHTGKAKTRGRDAWEESESLCRVCGVMGKQGISCSH